MKAYDLGPAGKPGQYSGHAHLFRLDPPYLHEDTDYSGDDPQDYIETIEYVVVSAANVSYSGPETYIFAADNEGNVTDWGELPGSFRGGLSHGDALNNIGYAVVRSLNAMPSLKSIEGGT